MLQKNLVFRGTTVAYNIEGEGPAVLLLHGFGEDAVYWKSQVEALRGHYRLILPDWPGSGASPYNDQFPEMDDYAELLKALLDSENIDSCVMLGHSMGGYITLAFVEKYPSYLLGFGLIHSSALPDSEEKKQAREKSIGFMHTQGAYGFMKTAIPGLFSEGFTAEHPEIVEYWVERSRNFSIEALEQYYRAMIRRPDRQHCLTGSKVPVLFIAGVMDKAIPFEDSMKQVHLASEIHVHILRDSAHMGPLEETEKVNTILGEFLQQCVSI